MVEKGLTGAAKIEVSTAMLFCNTCLRERVLKSYEHLKYVRLLSSDQNICICVQEKSQGESDNFLTVFTRCSGRCQVQETRNWDGVQQRTSNTSSVWNHYIPTREIDIVNMGAEWLHPGAQPSPLLQSVSRMKIGGIHKQLFAGGKLSWNMTYPCSTFN